MMKAHPTKFRVCLLLGSLTGAGGCSMAVQQEEQAYGAANGADERSMDAGCRPEHQTPEVPQACYLRQNPLAATAGNIDKGKWLAL